MLNRDILLKSAQNGEGGTFDPNNNQLQIFNKGYIVGVTKRYAKEQKDIYTIDDIIEMFKENDLTLKFIGYGKNEGKIYGDIVEVYNDKDIALQTAKELNELAIGDCENFEEIEV